MTPDNGPARPTPSEAYSDSELELDLRWWAAANYLTVAQIYLKATRCCANRSRSTTSSLACWATGAPAPACR